MKRLVLILLALSLFGCFTASVKLTTNEKFPPTDPEQVELFFEIPNRPYQEIGIVSASWDFGYVLQAINTLRAKAAEVGADAVILRQAGCYGVVGSAIIFADNSEEP